MRPLAYRDNAPGLGVRNAAIQASALARKLTVDDQLHDPLGYGLLVCSEPPLLPELSEGRDIEFTSTRTMDGPAGLLR
jgi:hypothetical protein